MFPSIYPETIPQDNLHSAISNCKGERKYNFAGPLQIKSDYYILYTYLDNF